MPPPILHGNSQPILPFIQSLHHCQHIPLQRQAMDSLLSYSDKVSGSHINSCPSCFGSCLSTLNLAFVLSPGLLWCSTHSPTTPDERMSLLQDTATRLLKVLPLVSAYDWWRLSPLRSTTVYLGHSGTFIFTFRLFLSLDLFRFVFLALPSGCPNLAFQLHSHLQDPLKMLLESPGFPWSPWETADSVFFFCSIDSLLLTFKSTTLGKSPHPRVLVENTSSLMFSCAHLITVPHLWATTILCWTDFMCLLHGFDHLWDIFYIYVYTCVFLYVNIFIFYVHSNIWYIEYCLFRLFSSATFSTYFFFFFWVTDLEQAWQLEFWLSWLRFLLIWRSRTSMTAKRIAEKEVSNAAQVIEGSI